MTDRLYLCGAMKTLEINRNSVEGMLDDRFLSSLVDNLPAMVFVKDARELKFIHFNHAGEEMLGISREQLIGKSDYDFFPKEQADQFVADDRKVLQSGKMKDIPEEPINTRFGRRFLHTKKIPLLGPTGEPEYLLGISEDITELRDSRDELRESRGQFERSLRFTREARRGTNSGARYRK